MANFGENLRQIRFSRGMTQDELAALLGTTKQVISRYENGQRIPKISTANEWAKILNVPISELTGAADDPDKDDVLALREALHENPDLRVLFDLGRDCTVAELRQTIAIIKALKGETDD